MANTILPKRKSTSGSAPASGDLQAGELAVNTADGRLYSKLSSDAVVNLPATSLAGAIVPGDVQFGEPAGGTPTGRVVIKGEDGTSLTHALVVQSPAVTHLFKCRNDGMVVVGAVNPDARLHVRGAGTTSSTKALLVTNNDGVALLNVFDGGTVGINKASPNTTLTVRGSGSAGSTGVFNLQNSNNQDVFRVQDDGDTTISGTLQFPASPTGTAPTGQGNIIFERVSNTSVRLRMRGTDNVLRSATLTLS